MIVLHMKKKMILLIKMKEKEREKERKLRRKKTYIDLRKSLMIHNSIRSIGNYFVAIVIK